MPLEHNMPRPRSESDEQVLSTAWDRLLYTLGSPPADEVSLDKPIRFTQRSEGRAQIPVTVLSGFLGAGKTTLLCKLLTESQHNILAIVNDVSAINIDAALIRSSSAETIQLENGCACCVLNSDLQYALAEIGARELTPDAIVIEASGLSDPMGIAQAVANNDTTVLDGVITLLDAETMHEYFDDPLSAPLVQRQLSAAHLICLSKTKGTEDISAMQTAISAIAPGRAIIALNAMDAELTEIVLGALMRGARPEPLGMHHDYAGFKTAIIEWPEAPSADAFFALLESIPDSVYRIKGWVTLQQKRELTRYEVQAAGPRWRVNRSAVAPDLEQLVIIGRHDSEAFTEFCESLLALQQPG